MRVKSLMGGLVNVVLIYTVESSRWLYRSYPALHKLQPFKEQRTIQGVKRKKENAYETGMRRRNLRQSWKN